MFRKLLVTFLCVFSLPAFATSIRSSDFNTPVREQPPIVREQNTRNAPPPLQKHELIIKNRTYTDIVRVEAKSIRMRNMSVNLLPYPIRPGRQGLVNLYDGNGSCDWSIITYNENGNTANKTLNVCDTRSLTISE